MVFRAKHAGVSYIFGRFNNVTGGFTYDPDNPTNSEFRATVDAQSIDTGVEKRDRHLRGPDFLNAKQFPEIRFVSKRVEQASDGTLRVTGDLTLHGRTKTVTATLTHVGSRDVPRMGHRTGFRGRFTINRSDFGMTYMLDNNMVGDRITVMLGLEGVRQSK